MVGKVRMSFEVEGSFKLPEEFAARWAEDPYVRSVLSGKKSWIFTFSSRSRATNFWVEAIGYGMCTLYEVSVVRNRWPVISNVR
jgi:hypothetical protein